MQIVGSSADQPGVAFEMGVRLEAPLASPSRDRREFSANQVASVHHGGRHHCSSAVEAAFPGVFRNSRM
jgi:hypothetical protein